MLKSVLKIHRLFFGIHSLILSAPSSGVAGRGAKGGGEGGGGGCIEATFISTILRFRRNLLGEAKFIYVFITTFSGLIILTIL